MSLRSEIETSTGADNADPELRSAIVDALLEGTAEWGDAVITVADNQSQPRSTAGRVDAGIVRIAEDGEVIYVGYYSDGGQHVLDIVDEGDTVQDWSDAWDNQNDCLPEYLRLEAGGDGVGI